jgi:hypothetical protein
MSEADTKSSNKRSENARKLLASKQKALGEHDADESFAVLPLGKRNVVMIARIGSAEDAVLPDTKEARFEVLRTEFGKYGEIVDLGERGPKLAFVAYAKAKYAEKAVGKANATQLLQSDDKGLMLSICKRTLKGMLEPKKTKAADKAAAAKNAVKGDSKGDKADNTAADKCEKSGMEDKGDEEKGANKEWVKKGRGGDGKGNKVPEGSLKEKKKKKTKEEKEGAEGGEEGKGTDKDKASNKPATNDAKRVAKSGAKVAAAKSDNREDSHKRKQIDVSGVPKVTYFYHCRHCHQHTPES